MKHKLLLRILVLILSTIIGYVQTGAQTTTRPAANNDGTVTTTVTTDDALTETTTREIKDKHGVTTRREEIKRFIDGTREETNTTLTPGGRPITVRILRFDKDGKIIEEDHKVYERGKLKKSGKANVTYNADGSAVITIVDRLKSETTTQVKTKEEVDRLNYYANPTGIKGSPFLEETPNDANAPQSCVPKADAYVGYSYLNMDLGNERAGASTGGNIQAQYHINHNIGIVADGSLHSRKWFEETHRNLILALGLQYSFTDPQCMRKLIAFVQLLPGLHQHTILYRGEKWQQEKAFAILAGGGLYYMFRLFTLQLLTHYHPVFWPEAIRHHFRIGLGIKIGIGNQ